MISRSGVVQDFQQTVTIDAGSMDHIKKDMYVIDAASGTGGLVGQVVQVSRSTSVVRLIDDKGFVVTVQSDDPQLTSRATITGQGPGVPLRLLVSDSQYALKVGQPFGTRFVPAADGFLPVPAAIPVGTVTRVTTQIGDNGASADVQPFFTPGALDYVGIVITQGRSFPRIALPPTPSPTPPAPPASPSASASATPSAQTSHATPTSAPPPPASPSKTPTSPSRSPSPSVRRSSSPSRASPSASRPPSSSPKP